MRKFLSFDEKLGVQRIQTTYSLGDLGTIRKVFSSGGLHTRPLELPKLPPNTGFITRKNLQGYIVRIPYELTTRLLSFFNATVPYLLRKQKTDTRLADPEYTKYVSNRDLCAASLSDLLMKTLLQERRLGIFNLLYLVVAKICREYLLNCIKEKQLPVSMKFAIYESLRELLGESWKRMVSEIGMKDSERRAYTPYFMGHIRGNLGDTYNTFFIQNIIQSQACFCTDQLLACSMNDIFNQVFLPDNPRYKMNVSEASKFYFIFREMLIYELQSGNARLLDFVTRDLGIKKENLRNLNLNILIFNNRVIRLLEPALRDLSTENSRGSLKSGKSRFGDAFQQVPVRLSLTDYIEEFINFSEDLVLTEIINLLWERIHISKRNEGSFSVNDVSASPSGTEVIQYDFSAEKIINDLRQFAILFLDIREFTAISDGFISSRDLKDNLYNFFDPVMSIIHHFQGAIRFYAGDGILATFGAVSGTSGFVVHALRAACEIQKYFWRLKKSGKVVFSGMGIGIHSGAVEDAYFFLSPFEQVQTIIGHNANLAGRLSSGKTDTGKDSISESRIYEFNDRLMHFLDSLEGVIDRSDRDGMYEMFEASFLKPLHKPDLMKDSEFFVDVTEGNLSNNGIAMSDKSFQDLRKTVSLTEIPGDNKINFLLTDPVIHERILICMEGNARFKGFEEHFPVWGIYLESLSPGLFTTLKKEEHGNE